MDSVLVVESGSDEARATLLGAAIAVSGKEPSPETLGVGEWARDVYQEEEIRRTIEQFGRVLMPDARDFGDVFYGRVSPIREISKYRGAHACSFLLDPSGRAYVSSVCPVWDGDIRYLEVTLQDETEARIRESMILSKDYVISLEVNVVSPQIAYVNAKYDRIIGSRLVAVIRPQTIPSFPVGP